MIRLSAEEIYTKLHVGNPGDLDFYRRVVKGAATILELGCGWGRLSGALADSGCQVTGMDNNAHFLERARSQMPQVDLVLGDACEADAWAFGTQKFDRILVPYNTLYSLGGPERVSQCFGLVRKHLAPDGELWLDVYPVDELHEALQAGLQPEEDDDEPVATWTTPDGPLVVRETTDFLEGESALRVTYQVTHQSTLCGTLEMRHDFLPVDDLLELLEANDLEVSCVWGDFEGSPLDSEPTQIIIGATANRAN